MTALAYDVQTQAGTEKPWNLIAAYAVLVLILAIIVVLVRKKEGKHETKAAEARPRTKEEL